jgi:hypothetical protein
MPSTAKAMAAEMGKPELAELAFQPTEEGRKASEEIGRYYYGKLLDQFGDPVLAAAAYNSGPGSVQQALQLEAEAKRRGEDRSWMDFLPNETKNYVRVVSRGHFADGGATDDVQPLVKRLHAMAKAAQKIEERHTEPLLGASDSAVAHALKVAGEAI